MLGETMHSSCVPVINIRLLTLKNIDNYSDSWRMEEEEEEEYRFYSASQPFVS
jgi:hypothetical protein